MKRLAIIALLLSGCVQGQSNQEIIVATHECKKAGLRAVMLCDGMENCRVQCRPHTEDCGHD